MEKAIKRFVALNDQERTEFLALLSFYLSTVARESYLEAGNNVTKVVSNFRVYNEMQQVVSKQLLATLGRSTPAYPHDVFLSVLVEDAKRSCCSESLAWAMYQSFCGLDPHTTRAASRIN